MRYTRVLQRCSSGSFNLTGHTGWVEPVAIGQLGGRDVIVSATNDRTVRIWDQHGPIGNPLWFPVTSEPNRRGHGPRYLLSEAGQDLAGVLETMASWGERWVEIGPDHTDPGFALWAWCTAQLNREVLPAGRVVVAFTFVDQPSGSRHYWLLVENGDAQVCYTDPGGETEV